MKYCITTAMELIQTMTKRIRIVQGGTSAGKTVAILWILLDYALTHPNKTISIISDTMKNLNKGAIKDFLEICTETNIISVGRWNITTSTFTLPNGSKIEFYSVETSDALGARRDVVFVNEANRITYDTFRELMVRTNDFVFLDFNPANEFYAHTELMNRPDADFVKLNYTQNEGLPDSIREELEIQRGDGTSNWWRVYGLGEIGSLEGNIYSGWIAETERPEGYILKRYGVDFGFTNDPTAIVAIYENEDGEIFLETKLCETRVLTPRLVDICKSLDDALFVCDNARPEIIAEMQANGVRAIGCDKTAGEKMNGKRYNIELVLRRKIHYLSGDRELEREYLTYQWRSKKTGEMLDEPQDGNDHIMDAIAYGIRDLAHKTIEWATPR